MTVIQRTIVAVILSAILALNAGCDTATGAATGAVVGSLVGLAIGQATGNRALGAMIGLGIGAVAGGLIGQINAEQRATLQAQSPQTLQTIQHNDEVYQQQQRQSDPARPQTPGPAPQGQSPPAPAETFVPLTVDDIKALGSAGVKNEVIIAEIERSQSVYTQADISALQQSNPNVDPAIVECMKRHSG
jgi:outer membrane lipoprotein SlyB